MRTTKRGPRGAGDEPGEQRRAQVADVQRPVGDGAKRPVTVAVSPPRGPIGQRSGVILRA